MNRIRVDRATDTLVRGLKRILKAWNQRSSRPVERMTTPRNNSINSSRCRCERSSCLRTGNAPRLLPPGSVTSRLPTTQLISAQSLARDLAPSLAADDDAQGGQIVRASATVTVSEAAQLLGIGRNLAYEIAARDGEIAGVPVIRVGRRVLIPLARLLEVLGLDDNSTRSEPTR